MSWLDRFRGASDMDRVAGIPIPGTTSDIVASSAGVERLRALLASTGPNGADAVGRTPLSYAAWLGIEPTVDALIDAHVPIDEADKSGRTPLFWAAWEWHAPIVDS